jgi:undecaprenyl-diphosphatase
MIKKILIFAVCFGCLACQILAKPARDSGEKDDCTAAVVFGITQGVTEFLPISSTAHMILADRILHGKRADDNSLSHGRSMGSYFTIIQCGSIPAAILLFRRRILDAGAALLGRSRGGLLLIRNLLISFLPAALVGLLSDGILQKLLYNLPGIAFALITGAALIFVAEKKYSREKNTLNVDELRVLPCLGIGLWQCLALMPGMSRLMATIVGGYFCRLRRREAMEYSFLLGIVTLSLATLFKIVKDHRVIFHDFTPQFFAIGILAAFVFSILTIRVFFNFLSTRGMGIFAWYRILLGLVILTLFY